MNRAGPTVRSRLLQTLRRSARPLSTGVLAQRCARENPRASAVTLTVLLKLEAAGVVRRHAPVVAGRGRPAHRWTLAAVCARAGQVVRL